MIIAAGLLNAPKLRSSTSMSMESWRGSPPAWHWRSWWLWPIVSKIPQLVRGMGDQNQHNQQPFKMASLHYA